MAMRKFLGSIAKKRKRIKKRGVGSRIDPARCEFFK